jgi:acetyl-CoA C-acetyltransferase
VIDVKLSSSEFSGRQAEVTAKQKRVAIIGYGAVKVGRYPERQESDLAMAAIRDALKDARITKHQIEGLFTTPDLQGNIGLQPNLLCEYLRISPKSMAEICCGAIAGGLTLKYAADEIQAGRINIAVCYGAAREASINWFKSVTQDHGWSMIEPTALQPYAAYGIIWAYALSARRYMHETGATEEDFALAAVRNRKNAAGSPVAAFTKPLTVDDVLNSRSLSSPIKLLDSAASLDGAAAVVLASEETARNLSHHPVYLLGWGLGHDNSCVIPTDDCKKSICHFTATREAARRAFLSTGIKPGDVDVAEIYAPFSSHELIIPEDIGWYQNGEMVKAMRNGETEIGGKIPINTDGGLTSRGHPWPVTPLYETINIVRQLRGEAGSIQVKDAKVGLMHCEGGMMNNGLVMLFGRD